MAKECKHKLLSISKASALAWASKGKLGRVWRCHKCKAWVAD